MNLSTQGLLGNDASSAPSISADGRYVAFASAATNLVPGNANPTRLDVYVRDLQTLAFTRVSVSSAGVQGNGGSSSPAISADGRYVAFTSHADNLVAADTNGAEDVFVHDRQTGITERASVSSAGLQGNGASYAHSISADGRCVLIQSSATNLDAGDTNGVDDMFVHDRQSGVTQRVSLSSSGAQGNDISGWWGSISADGRFVAFGSLATNLVAGDTNGVEDIFVRDRQTNQTSLASVNSAGVQADDYSWYCSISGDGRFVAFTSGAHNLVPGAGGNIFIRDRQTGQTTCGSVSSAGVPAVGFCYFPNLSSDGRYVEFTADASNLVPGDTNNQEDFFVHDRLTGQTERVSVDSAGNQCNGTNQFIASLSADGRYVAFDSDSTNLVQGDTNGKVDVFLRDRQLGKTTLVSGFSGGIEADAGSAAPSVSADGRYVAFASDAANLLAGDTNGASDVFVRDTQTAQTTRASVSSAAVEANDASTDPALSADGRFVVFVSRASNLVAGDSNSVSDVFVHDRQSGQTERVSVSSSGFEGNLECLDAPAISSDGRYVAFVSRADNLVPGDGNACEDIFVRDRQSGFTTRVSVDSAGVQSDGAAWHPSISADGRFISFHSYATNLVAMDTNGCADVFVRDRLAGQTVRASLDSSGGEANADSYRASISPDGGYVAFTSGATNLVAADTNGRLDVFVHELQSGLTERVSIDTAGVESNGDADRPSISTGGSLVVFESNATNLAYGDTNASMDIFSRSRPFGETRRESVGSSGGEANGASTAARISATGRYVALISSASNLVPGDTNGKSDVFVHDRAGCAPTATVYCTAKTNSLGCVPLIAASTSGSLKITATLLVSQQNGLLFYGLAPLALPFQGAFKCVAAPTARTPVVNSGGTGGCTGSITFDMGARIVSGLDPHLVPGAHVYTQIWSRDPGALYGTNLTAGLEFVIGP